jgi:hypothetical protein
MLVGCLLGFFIGPEDGGDTFFRNVDYTALQARRQLLLWEPRMQLDSLFRGLQWDFGFHSNKNYPKHLNDYVQVWSEGIHYVIELVN